MGTKTSDLAGIFSSLINEIKQILLSLLLPLTRGTSVIPDCKIRDLSSKFRLAFCLVRKSRTRINECYKL